MGAQYDSVANLKVYVCKCEFSYCHYAVFLNLDDGPDWQFFYDGLVGKCEAFSINPGMQYEMIL